MSPPTFKPTLYVMEGCPYSFRFLLFLSEAQLLDGFDVVKCDDRPECDAIKQTLEAAMGREPSFPVVEVAPGEYMSDSDRLIDHFARLNRIDRTGLPALVFYEDSIFPQLEALHA